MDARERQAGGVEALAQAADDAAEVVGLQGARNQPAGQLGFDRRSNGAARAAVGAL